MIAIFAQMPFVRPIDNIPEWDAKLMVGGLVTYEDVAPMIARLKLAGATDFSVIEYEDFDAFHAAYDTQLFERGESITGRF